MQRHLLWCRSLKLTFRITCIEYAIALALNFARPLADTISKHFALVTACHMCLFVYRAQSFSLLLTQPRSDKFITQFIVQNHGWFWVWAQPMRHDLTLQRRSSLAEPIPRMIREIPGIQLRFYIRNIRIVISYISYLQVANYFDSLICHNFLNHQIAITHGGWLTPICVN